MRFFSLDSKKTESAPLIKNWVGITTTRRSENLDIKAIFRGGFNERFKSDDSELSILFRRQCEIFSAKTEAFRWMGYRVGAKKSTYVLETPYDQITLIHLINTGHFHECFTQAINVRDYNLFNHDPSSHHKIDTDIIDIYESLLQFSAENPHSEAASFCKNNQDNESLTVNSYSNHLRG